MFDRGVLQVSGYRARIMYMDTDTWAQDVPFHFRHLAADYLVGQLAKAGYSARGTIRRLMDGEPITFEERTYMVVKSDDVPAPAAENPVQAYRVTIGQESTGDVSAEYEFDTKDDALDLLEFLLQKEFQYDDAELEPQVRRARFIRWVLNGKFIEMNPVTELDPGAVEKVEPSTHLGRLTRLLEEMETSFTVNDEGSRLYVILEDVSPGHRSVINFNHDGSFRSMD